MMSLITVSVCTLNQWALDFEGNLHRILSSIQKAREEGAAFRTGPELEVCGYGCDDHFHESDTLLHSWEVLAEIMQSPLCDGMLVDVGMPVQHKGVNYNCRVVVFNREVLLIRPKQNMCDDGNYRESRWFTAWTKIRQTESHTLPDVIRAIVGQKSVPFGDAVIATEDTCIGFEICEDLWIAQSPNTDMFLDGVEVIANGSASAMALNQPTGFVPVIQNATAKSGGCYLFSNMRGCDGGQRIRFTGCAGIFVNGETVNRAKQFGLEEVEVVTSTIDLEEIRSYKNGMRSRDVGAARAPAYPRIEVAFALSELSRSGLSPAVPMEWRFHTMEEELLFGPAAWLWDCLRRSDRGGFFLPLDGGVGSCGSAVAVYSMCNMVVEAVRNGDEQVLEDVRRIVGESEFVPKDPKSLCRRILFTCFMASEESTKSDVDSSQKLADEIGSHHFFFQIGTAVSAFTEIFARFAGLSSILWTESVMRSLRSMKSRIRSVLSYLFAQLVLRDLPLFVLGSTTLDEALLGTMDKYGVSSAADINPVGGIASENLHRLLKFAQQYFHFEFEFGDSREQSEVITFGHLRKQKKCGPLSLFVKSNNEMANASAEKVKKYFRQYAQNRHKLTVTPPSYHFDGASPDDNRADHRPFLYNTEWTWQFRAIEKLRIAPSTKR